MSDLGRRVRVLRIGDQFISMFFGDFEHHYKIVKDAIPLGARVVRCEMSPGFLPEFRLLLESPEFGPVDDGCAIPEINPMITNIGSSITEADIDRIQAEEAVSESVKFREFL